MNWRTGSGALWLGVALACGGDGDATTGEDLDTSDTSDSGQLTGETTAEPTTAGGVCEAGQHSGEATYYGADGSGNCSFDAGPDVLIAAMNDADYANAAACGACVEVAGPDATIVVRIVDRCPGCPQGDIDLGEAAFPMIAAKELGRVPISWQYVSCPVEGPLVYRFKEGSSEFWTAVQVRNHRNAIAGFEYREGGGAWQSVQRVEYNYFIDEGGMGPGPIDFRVTDVLGHVVEDHGLLVVDGGSASGAGQFPACLPWRGPQARGA